MPGLVRLLKNMCCAAAVYPGTNRFVTDHIGMPGGKVNDLALWIPGFIKSQSALADSDARGYIPFNSGALVSTPKAPPEFITGREPVFLCLMRLYKTCVRFVQIVRNETDV